MRLGRWCRRRDTGRRTLGSALSVIGIVASSLALPLGLVGGQGAQAATSAVTVNGNNAWDAANNQDFTDPSTVTVAQTTGLTDQVVHVTWTNFTPSNNPYFSTGTAYPVRVYQCQGTSVTQQSQCAGSSDYMTKNNVNSVTQTNLVQTFTSPDGTGSADIALHTSTTDSDLGCDSSHACSITVVPNWGGNMNTNKCTDHTQDTETSDGYASGNTTYMESDCAWHNRIVVPISFSRDASVCDQGEANFAAAGAPMLARAVNLWRAGVCTGSTADRVGYDSGVNEYAARRDFVSGRSDMALTSQPATEQTAGGRTYSYAPLAGSGIAIAYYVDNANTGQPITDLKLNARLVAKMVTESYHMGLNCPTGTIAPCAPEVTGNPWTIFFDPEFQKLNPQYHPFDFAGATAHSLPVVLQGDSDMTYALTRWLDADPAAHAFLHGQEDPWGMTVNKYYLPTAGVHYPISAFTANDPGQTVRDKDCSTVYACDLYGMQAMWNPVNGLDRVAGKLLTGQNSAIDTHALCGGTTGAPIVNHFCANHSGEPALSVGQRALFAIVPVGDAVADRFPTAALQTSGDHFVQPSVESMTAALPAMKNNADGVTQHLDYAKASEDAYPLTTMDYAMVPTCGLSDTKIGKISQFLNYTSSDAGQVYGTLPGQLAPGFVELTDAQKAQSAKAVSSMSPKACTAAGGAAPGGGDKPPTGGGNPPSGGDKPPTGDNPPADNPAPGGGSDGPPDANNPDGSHDNPSDNGPGGGSDGASDNNDNGNGSGGSDRNGNKPAGHHNVAAENRSGHQDQNVSFGKATPDHAGWTRIMLPLLLIVGGVLLLGGPAALVLGRTGAGAVILARAKTLLRRG